MLDVDGVLVVVDCVVVNLTVEALVDSAAEVCAEVVEIFAVVVARVVKTVVESFIHTSDENKALFQNLWIKSATETHRRNRGSMKLSDRNQVNSCSLASDWHSIGL